MVADRPTTLDGEHAPLAGPGDHVSTVLIDDARAMTELEAAVAMVDVPVERDRPIPSASEEPRVSTIVSHGRWRASPAFTGADHMIPELTISHNDDRSQWRGEASSSARRGRAKASPTIVIWVTRSRATMSSASAVENERPGARTTEPPLVNTDMAVNRAVPCISGGPGRSRGRGWREGLRIVPRTSARVPSSRWRSSPLRLRMAQRSS